MRTDQHRHHACHRVRGRDFTHYRLAGGQHVEIITWLDDHSRYALHVSAHRRITATIVRDSFRNAAAQHGYPAATLTDNGMVYTVRLASRRSGRTALETELSNPPWSGSHRVRARPPP